MARRKTVPEPKPGLPNLDKYLVGRKSHYVSYVDGAKLYQLPYQTFVKLVRAAKANLKMRHTVIIDVDLIEQCFRWGFTALRIWQRMPRRFTRSEADR